jgi:uncharacterized membrane protein (DUF373 family)
MLRRLFDDGLFLQFTDRAEQQLAKALAGILIIVMVVATVQLAWTAALSLANPGTVWDGDQLFFLLGDLLNLLIALEVLQNLTSYLRRGVVQIELVLLTAITAVARKVIVLDPDAESKPQLLIGLGIAVVSLAAAYWLVRHSNPFRSTSRRAPTRSFPGPDRSPPPGGGVPH